MNKYIHLQARFILMKISILTPTIRPQGLIYIQESLKKQTLQDFEWLVEIGCPWKGIDLCKSMNRMLKRSNGEIVISWQDYIVAKDDALECFWDKYTELGKRILITAPVGKTSDWKDIAWDWRKYKDGAIEPNEWEADFACAPLQAFKDIGGYDEQFDNAWSWENADVALRASKAGYSFYCDNRNQAVAFDHDKAEKHPWRGGKTNADLFNTKKSLLNSTNYPFKLNYL